MFREQARGLDVMSFEYRSDWLGRPAAFSIDPSLGLWDGEQHFDHLPGAVADCAPDRWGRSLMDRREAITARRERRKPRKLREWDYLTGVSDIVRMGALRFREPAGGFIDTSTLPVPPLSRLRVLQKYARDAERSLPSGPTEEEQWLRMLIAPGSSLGGARPKANYLEEDGSLWIAKFPSRSDSRDIGAWEYVLNVLAARVGIATPEAKLLRLGSTFGTFAARRFDRTSAGARRFYVSAMTLTGHSDGQPASYLDIALAIRNHGAASHIREDQQQLFLRLAFNVIFANRDDHLRNHGFIRTPRGWRLSPVFDINPGIDQIEHSLSIDETLHSGDLELVVDTAPLYGVRNATDVINGIRRSVRDWRDLAKGAGIEREEIDRVGSDFQIDS
jgi:serine/threonine-protein kinase HipA